VLKFLCYHLLILISFPNIFGKGLTHHNNVPPLISRFISFTKHHVNYDKKFKINQQLKLGLLIEGKSGFEALPLILENLSTHIDLIYFGLFDFASSQNIEPDWDSKTLGSLLAEVISEANKNNISVGTIARTKRDIEILNKMGVSYIVYLNDLGILNDAIKEI